MWKAAAEAKSPSAVFKSTRTMLGQYLRYRSVRGSSELLVACGSSFIAYSVGLSPAQMPSEDDLRHVPGSGGEQGPCYLSRLEPICEHVVEHKDRRRLHPARMGYLNRLAQWSSARAFLCCQFGWLTKLARATVTP